MAQELLLVIVSASSALIGALIPTWFNYKNNQKQNKFITERALHEKQKDIYWQVMSALQNIINNTSQANILELQKTVLMISIYGDNETSKSMNNYYGALIESSRTMVLLTGTEHQKYQKEIINCMRSNLGLNQLEKFEILSYRPKS